MIKLKNLFLPWKVIKELRQEKKYIEENAKTIINFLQKAGLRMLLWEKELSYGENWGKITDGKSVVAFEVLFGEKIPRLEAVEYMCKLMEKGVKK